MCVMRWDGGRVVGLCVSCVCVCGMARYGYAVVGLRQQGETDC